MCGGQEHDVVLQLVKTLKYDSDSYVGHNTRVPFGLCVNEKWKDHTSRDGRLKDGR